MQFYSSSIVSGKKRPVFLVGIISMLFINNQNSKQKNVRENKTTLLRSCVRSFAAKQTQRHPHTSTRKPTGRLPV